MKGLISGISTFISIPFLLYGFVIATSFYASALSLLTNSFFAVWQGPTYTMINRIFPSNVQGLAISMFALVSAIATSSGTFIIGALSDHVG